LKFDLNAPLFTPTFIPQAPQGKKKNNKKKSNNNSNNNSGEPKGDKQTDVGLKEESLRTGKKTDNSNN